MWFVGIDWGDRAHEIAAVDEHGGSGGTLHIPHTADGLRELIHWLMALSPSGGRRRGKATGDPERIACMVETSAGLLVTALLDAGFAVYPVNPRHWAAAQRCRRQDGSDRRAPARPAGT